MGSPPRRKDPERLLVFLPFGALHHKTFKIEYIRSTGLLSSKRDPMMSDSPDGILCFVGNEGEMQVTAIEIKTITSLHTIDGARQRRHKYASITYLKNIGQNVASIKQFHELAMSSEYRTQFLHHSVCLNVNHIVFVQAKGSNCGMVEVINVTVLHFHWNLMNNYSYVLSAVRVGAFKCVRKDSSNIPKAYDTLLQTSHAADLHSYASYYGLSQAYRSLSLRNRTLPPAQMIRPTGFIYWNYLKGGFDEFSRANTNFCYTNVGANLIVSIIGRLLCAQVNNAAVVQRLCLARQKGQLPKNNTESDCKGYRQLRKNVTICSSFADAARHLAKEYVEAAQASTRTATSASSNGNAYEPMLNVVSFVEEPMYRRDVADKFNREEDKKRGLANTALHFKVRRRNTYCAICSYSHTIKKNGKSTEKKEEHNRNSSAAFAGRAFLRNSAINSTQSNNQQKQRYRLKKQISCKTNQISKP